MLRTFPLHFLAADFSFAFLLRFFEKSRVVCEYILFTKSSDNRDANEGNKNHQWIKQGHLQDIYWRFRIQKYLMLYIWNLPNEATFSIIHSLQTTPEATTGSVYNLKRQTLKCLADSFSQLTFIVILCPFQPCSRHSQEDCSEVSLEATWHGQKRYPWGTEFSWPSVLVHIVVGTCTVFLRHLLQRKTVRTF